MSDESSVVVEPYRSRLVRSSRGVVTAVEIYDLWFDVEYDPNLETLGVVVYDPKPTIKLREWDSEVFLHECIHVAFATNPPPGFAERPQHGQPLDRMDVCWWRYRGRITDSEQEGFVRHLSHFLDDIGYRLEAYDKEQAP